jgi:hypothetical protein
VRKHVIKFFKKGPLDSKVFFYGWEGKTYSKKEIDPKLKLMIKYIDCATSLIECEHVNSSFIQKMLESSALILLTNHSEELNKYIEEYWIAKLL